MTARQRELYSSHLILQGPANLTQTNLIFMKKPLCPNNALMDSLTSTKFCYHCLQPIMHFASHKILQTNLHPLWHNLLNEIYKCDINIHDKYVHRKPSGFSYLRNLLCIFFFIVAKLSKPFIFLYFSRRERGNCRWDNYVII